MAALVMGPFHSRSRDTPATNIHSSQDSESSITETDEIKPKLYLLFDLNKTLTEHIYVPKSTGVNSIRPGIEQLHRLLPHYQIGIYSSSSPKTVDEVIMAIQEEAGESDNGTLFDDPEMVLHRSHTLPATVCEQNRSGKYWATVKPIHPYFPDMSSVLLIDDEPNKVLTEEITNLVTIPPWSGDDDDRVLKLLVDVILSIVPTDRTVDLRDYSSKITNSLWNVSASPLGLGSENGDHVKEIA